MRFLPRTSRRLTVGRAIAAASLGLAMLVPAAPAAVGGMPPTVSFHATIDGCELYGKADLGTAGPLIIRLRAKDGTLKRKLTLTVINGFWGRPCLGSVMRAGDRLQFFVKGKRSPFRTFRIPDLRARLDRVDDVLRGTIGSNADSMQVTVRTCDAADAALCSVAGPTPVNPPLGTGSFAMLVADATGRSSVDLIWQRGSATVVRSAPADQLIVQPGSSVVTGHGSRVGRKVTVTVRRGARTGRGSATVVGGGFRVVIRRNGAPMALEPGDVVTADLASDTTLTVPPALVGFTESTIYGRCFQGADVTVIVREVGAVGFFVYHASASPVDGSWSVEATTGPGDRVETWCANGRGDQLLMRTTRG